MAALCTPRLAPDLNQNTRHFSVANITSISITIMKRLLRHYPPRNTGWQSILYARLLSMPAFGVVRTTYAAALFGRGREEEPAEQTRVFHTHKNSASFCPGRLLGSTANRTMKTQRALASTSCVYALSFV